MPPRISTSRPSLHTETCSVDDEFEVGTITSAPGGWRVASFTNFEPFLTGLTSDVAIADTTAQRTTEDATGASHPLGAVTTYPSGSLRLYLSVSGFGEYSLLSANGLDFEVEVGTSHGIIHVTRRRLDKGQGQAEAYWGPNADGTDVVWMYYNDQTYIYEDGSGSHTEQHGVCVKTSEDGVTFTITGSAGASTGLTYGKVGRVDNSGLLCGLSVVATRGEFKYRGYFSFAPPMGSTDWTVGTIYAATSGNLQDWTPQATTTTDDGDGAFATFSTVGLYGEILGPDSGSDIQDICMQPFALKRHDPEHPNAVTLFYYRSFETPPSSKVYYCTSLDGVTFNAADEKELSLGDGDVFGDGSSAGPTIVAVRGLDGWVSDPDNPTYLLYTDTQYRESDGTTSSYIQARTLKKVV